MIQDYALLFSCILALGIGAQWLSWSLKQPSILFLLIIGIIIGPCFHLFNPDQVLGDLLFPMVSLGVAVILFEGSLTLNLHEIKQHGRVVQNLVTIGLLVTVAVISTATYYLFDIDLKIAILFGALVCVTGPTVIAPLLRSTRLNKNVSNVLKWEGIIIDPLGALAVVLVYEYILSGREGDSLLVFGETVGVAVLLGAAGAVILAFLIKRYLVPEYLRPVFTFAFVLLSFSFSNYLVSESGLLTVTILGIVLANWKGFPRDHLLEFHESLTLMLVSVLFIVLAARVNLNELLGLGWQGIILLLIVMFVARPLAIFLSSIRSNLSFNEKLMVSWIGPRGIVAAAVSSLFALRLENSDLKGVELLVPLVFLIIIGTVVIQGLGAKLVGTILGVRNPKNNGVLFVGANTASIGIAKILQTNGLEVLIADTNYADLSKARMEGIRTYYGSPVSSHARFNMDLIGIGHLFAMSKDKEMNSLSDMYFRHDFGERNIYRLQAGDEKTQSKSSRDKRLVSQWLFGSKVTYSKMASLISQNAKVKQTKITATYTYEDFLKNNKKAIPLFLILDKNDVLRVVTDDFHPSILDGEYRMFSLVPEQEKEKTAESNAEPLAGGR